SAAGGVTSVVGDGLSDGGVETGVGASGVLPADGSTGGTFGAGSTGDFGKSFFGTSLGPGTEPSGVLGTSLGPGPLVSGSYHAT
ncbi:UNVERIFIED_CONTAM: hypothetical protein NY603_29770, partial [Bacteroidetes bacterium 56_B9]